MTDLAASDAGTDAAEQLVVPAIETSTLVALTAADPSAPTAPGASAEIDALDALWEQRWDVEESRAYAPQQVGHVAPEHSITELRARRAIDVMVALVGLIVLAPVLLLIAVAVRLSSPGSAIFVQHRPGRGGELFPMYKFRSMDAGTESAVLDDDAQCASYHANDFKLDADDPRITPLGRVLRQTSLDELPQLVNVLRGDMSLVGVRPLLPEQLEKRPIVDQMLYRSLRPGLTGLWQVEGRSNISGDARMALDRTYVNDWSLAGDLKVLARTPLALLRGDGAH